MPFCQAGYSPSMAASARAAWISPAESGVSESACAGSAGRSTARVRTRERMRLNMANLRDKLVDIPMIPLMRLYCKKTRGASGFPPRAMENLQAESGGFSADFTERRFQYL